MSFGKNCCWMKTRLYFIITWRQNGGKLEHVAVKIKKLKVRGGALHLCHKQRCSRIYDAQHYLILIQNLKHNNDWTSENKEILSVIRTCSCGKLKIQYHLSTGMAMAQRFHWCPSVLRAPLDVREASVAQEAQEVFAQLVF